MSLTTDILLDFIAQRGLLSDLIEFCVADYNAGQCLEHDPECVSCIACELTIRAAFLAGARAD